MYKVLEAWIGSQTIPAWAHINIWKAAVTGFPSAFQPFTRLILFPKPRVDQGNSRRGNIGAMRGHEHAVQDEEAVAQAVEVTRINCSPEASYS